MRVPTMPAARLAPAIVLALVLLIACNASGGSTPPPSGACVVADARNNVELNARDVRFSAPCIEATAGMPIVIRFTNEESMPHNVAVYTNSSKQTEVVKGEIITGPNATTTVTVPAQPAGQLYFKCSVHDTMNGALVVRPAPEASAAAS